MVDPVAEKTSELITVEKVCRSEECEEVLKSSIGLIDGEFLQASPKTISHPGAKND